MGGITQAVYQYAKSNNKYKGEKFNPEMESTHLQYQDVSNLYGWAMVKLLPTGRFNLADPNKFKTKKL